VGVGRLYSSCGLLWSIRMIQLGSIVEDLIDRKFISWFI
jgi:hypothetical protein